MAARYLRGPVASQVRLFVILAIAGTAAAAISALNKAWTAFYASLGFLAASPYIASLLVYVAHRKGEG